MTNKEFLFAGLHILMLAIPDGQADAGRRLCRYWYRESRCQVRTGWQKLCALCGYKSVKICVNPVNLVKKTSCLGVFVAKTPRNLRNPWLMNYLHACKALYICRETSTSVESSLQISSFLTNKANFRKSQMNVNKVLTRDYEKRTLGERGKNKPNSNPIQTQSNPIKANKMPKQTQFKANSNPKQTQTNPMLARHSVWRRLSAISVAGQRKKMLPLNLQMLIFHPEFLQNCPSFWLKNIDISKKVSSERGKKALRNSRIEHRQTPVKYPDNYRGVLFNRGFYLYTATLLKAQETHLALYQS